MAVRRHKQRRRRKMGKKSGKPVTRADKRLSRRISKLENSIEKKYLDFTTDDFPTNNGIAKSLLSGMADGNNYNQRIGNEVVSNRIFFQYRLFNPAYADSPPAAPAQVRMLLLWDKQFNGFEGGVFNIFTGTSPTTLELSTALLDNRSGMISINAPYNQNTKDRFQILYDKVHNMNHGSDIYGVVHNVKKMIPLHNAKVKYSDATSGQATLPSRNLVLVYFDSLSTEPTNINWTMRYFYTDA